MNISEQQASPVFFNLFRADLYRAISLALDFPNENSILTIAEIAEALSGSEVTTIQLKPMIETLRHCSLSENLSELEQEYFRIFKSGIDCPESEGSYYPVDRGAVVGDVCAFYDAFGLKTVPKQGPPDSMKMELAFMSCMALKEAYLEQNGEVENLEIVLDAEKKFLQDHLGRWGFIFSHKLRESAESDFYRQIGFLLEFFLEFEIQKFQINPFRVDHYFAAKDSEALDSQFDCALGAMQNPPPEP